MNTRTIVTVMTAALLSVVLVPASSAQTSIGGAQDGIEVITIIGKRPAPALAAACVNGVATSTDAAAQPNGDGNVSEEVQESGRTSASSPRRTIERCSEQAATPPFEAHI